MKLPHLYSKLTDEQIEAIAWKLPYPYVEKVRLAINSKASNQLICAVKQGQRINSVILDGILTVCLCGDGIPDLALKSIDEKLEMVCSLSQSAAQIESLIEKEILSHMANGLTGKEIATQMTHTPATIETYKDRLFKKFKARNGNHLISIAYQKGILTRSIENLYPVSE